MESFVGAPAEKVLPFFGCRHCSLSLCVLSGSTQFMLKVISPSLTPTEPETTPTSRELLLG